MSGTVNDYWRELTAEEIAAGKHREFVGGLWDEIGALQFDFLRAQGLAPDDALLDVGCGALRGGVHFIRYLAAGRYCGLDVNASLLDAGRRELGDALLRDKAPHLVVSSEFDFAAFGRRFPYALAVSVFTHLDLNRILLCLARMREALAPGGRFFATWFEAPAPACREPQRHAQGIVTYYLNDPYHYAFAEMEAMAALAGMRVERIGDWGHPRGQRMLCFRA
ncbi:MAG: class I SAM-dependent methyltransferase [Burkholderiales bacterium]